MCDMTPLYAYMMMNYVSNDNFNMWDDSFMSGLRERLQAIDSTMLLISFAHHLEFKFLKSNQYQTFKSKKKGGMGWFTIKKKNSNAHGQFYENQIQMCTLSCNHQRPNSNVHAQFQPNKL